MWTFVFAAIVALNSSNSSSILRFYKPKFRQLLHDSLFLAFMITWIFDSHAFSFVLFTSSRILLCAIYCWESFIPDIYFMLSRSVVILLFLSCFGMYEFIIWNMFEISDNLEKNEISLYMLSTKININCQLFFLFCLELVAMLAPGIELLSLFLFGFYFRSRDGNWFFKWVCVFENFFIYQNKVWDFDWIVSFRFFQRMYFKWRKNMQMIKKSLAVLNKSWQMLKELETIGETMLLKKIMFWWVMEFFGFSWFCFWFIVGLECTRRRI